MLEPEKIISRLLHIDVQKRKGQGAKRLPPQLEEAFETEVLEVESAEVLFAAPRRPLSLPRLRAGWEKLEEASALPCVLCLEETNPYGRERMIELGIPFLMGEENLYLPFLGAALIKKRTARLPQISRFTPAAQKMVLTAIYENWGQLSAREISERMNVSRMTVSRNLAELQALGLPLVAVCGREKRFSCETGSRRMLELCAPYLDNPVQRAFYLEEIPKGAEYLGGRSAIARYSLLSDHPYLTYAVTREELRGLHLEECHICTGREEAACQIHVVRYRIAMGKLIDPVSAVLCVTAQEKTTPREEAALKRMLEDYLKKK